MITRDELLKTKEFWFETSQNEIYRMVSEYLINEGITRAQFAEKLGVTKGYVSQILNGNFNATLKKLIELSLAAGQAPVLGFKPLETILSEETRKTPELKIIGEQKVAEPESAYHKPK